MRHLLLAGVAAGGLALSAPAAQAMFVGTIPMGASNEVLPPLTLIEGFFGAQLFLFGGPADIKVTLIGYEAGFTNTFRWIPTGDTLVGGGGSLGTVGIPIGTNFTVVGVPSGLLPFEFDTSGPATGDVKNGDNVDPGLNKGNFFLTLGDCPAIACIDNIKNGVTPASGQVAWVWFDDLGAGPDDNHDDLVVRIEITSGFFQVPEPATLGLLGAGLLGLGFAARRRRNA